MTWIAGTPITIFAILILGAIGLWVWKPWVPALQMAAPGESGRRIAEFGLIANFYPGTDAARAPAGSRLAGRLGRGGINGENTGRF